MNLETYLLSIVGPAISILYIFLTGSLGDKVIQKQCSIVAVKVDVKEKVLSQIARSAVIVMGILPTTISVFIGVVIALYKVEQPFVYLAFMIPTLLLLIQPVHYVVSQDFYTLHNTAIKRIKIGKSAGAKRSYAGIISRNLTMMNVLLILAPSYLFFLKR